MKYLAPIPKQFVDHNGLPLSDGKVHVYISGDTQYANVYQDADGEELMPNPVRLDSNGAWQGFVTAGIPMDYVVEDKDGNVQFEYEKVTVSSGEGGGGGGGSDVIVEQVLTNGTEIADIFIDGERTPLFAPTPLELGETSTTAYPGNMGKAAHELANTANTSAVKNVAYDSANKKITKTINGQITDVVDIATLKVDMELGTAASKNVPTSGNASNTEVVLGSDTRLSAGASAVQDVTVDGASVVNQTTKIAAIPNASTSVKGAVQLEDSHTSTSTTKAATPKNVKEAYDLANSKADLASVVDSAVYDSANHAIVFKHGQTQLFTLDATAFVKDGMVDSVTIANGNLVITFNTDAGKQPISIPLTDIFDPDNYYTKTATNTLLTGKQDKVFQRFEYDSTLQYSNVSAALLNGMVPYLIDGRTMFVCDGSAYNVEVSGSTTTEYRFVAAVGNDSPPRIVYRYVRADNTRGSQRINLATYSSVSTLESAVADHNKFFHTETLNVSPDPIENHTRFLKISFSGRVGRASAIVLIGANNGNDSSVFRLSWFYNGTNPIGNFGRELFSVGNINKKPLVYYDDNSFYIGLSEAGNWGATISVMLACENPNFVSYDTVTRAVATGSGKTNLPLEWFAVYSKTISTIVKDTVIGNDLNAMYVI